MTDDLADVGTTRCAICGELMEAEGDVRDVDRGDGVLVTEGSAWWQCPRDGFAVLV